MRCLNDGEDPREKVEGKQGVGEGRERKGKQEGKETEDR